MTDRVFPHAGVVTRTTRIAAVIDAAVGTIGPGTWLVPTAVDLRDGWLLPDWSDPMPAAPPGDPRSYIIATASAGLLRGFLTLARPGPDSRILAYASEVGMLGLSKLEADRAGDGGPWLPGPEPVSEWRSLARRARTTILLAHRVRRPRGPGLWSPLFLETDLAWWMWQGDVRPRLVWRGDGPSVALGSGTLLGELAVRLLYAAAGGGDLLMMCADCGEWDISRRRPSPGMAYRCPRHRGAANARRYRDLNRADPGRARLPRGRPGRRSFVTAESLRGD